MDERTGAEPSPAGAVITSARVDPWGRREHQADSRRARWRRWTPRRLLTVSSMALLLPACPAAVPNAPASPAANDASKPATAPAACASLYTVVSGDSWFQIARRAGVSMNALLTANAATAESALFPGMQLCVPTSTSAATATTAATTTTAPSTATTSPANLPVQLAAFPVQGPCYFIDTWQAPRGGGRLHEGVDVMAKAGQYVYAVADGRLSRQTVDRPGSLSGNAWWLTAADGTYYFYAHLSAFAPDLKVGSRVVAGQIIGFVGRTGNAAGPHLHFEVHPKGGTAVNPTPIVRAVDGCKNTTPPPQPSGALPPTPSTLPPAGSSGSTAPATTVPTATVPATTAPPAPPAPAPPTNTSPTAPAAGALWQFISPKTAYDSSWNGGTLAPMTRQSVTVSGLAGVPRGTRGVMVRLTAANAAGAGYLVTFPCDSSAPLASMLTFPQGGSAVGTSTVRVTNGQICVLSNVRVKAKVEVLAAQAAGGVGMQPITATRVLDTRTSGRLAPGAQVQLSNATLGVPTGAQAMTVTVTFVDPAAAGTYSMGFCGQGPWTTPFSADAISSFSITMRTSSSGWCLSSSVATDVLIDVTAAWAGGSTVATVDPLRIYDSRGAGPFGPFARAVQVAGLGGVPAGATSAVLALTLVTGDSATSVFAHPCNEGYASGNVVAVQANRVTTVVVPVRLSGGQVCLTSIRSADVIVDVVGAG